MMTLLLILIPVSPPQVSLGHGVGITYEFVKKSTMPRGSLGINLRANIFGASNESDEL